MRGVLLASGGIDSTVMLYWLKKLGRLDSVFFVNYGQASATTQRKLLEGHCHGLNVELKECVVDWPRWGRGKGHIFEQESYPETQPDDPYATTQMTQAEVDEYLEHTWDFIQGRNVVFCAHAAAWAIHRRVPVVYTAFQFDQPEWDAADESGGFGTVDTSPAFVEGFNVLAASGAFTKPVRLEAPFLEARMTKQAIVDLGKTLMVPLSKTHSCEFYPPCGECHQCKIRKEVLGKPYIFK